MPDRLNGENHHHEEEEVEMGDCEHGCSSCQILWGCIGECDYDGEFLMTCPACVGEKNEIN
jgi:hypothetical protein